MMFAGGRRVQTLAGEASSPSSSDDDTDARPDSDSENANKDPDLEPWAEYMQRVTHNIEARLDGMYLEDWVWQARRKKWRFAGKTACLTDQRWTSLPNTANSEYVKKARFWNCRKTPPPGF